MIPEFALTQWRNTAPWPENYQQNQQYAATNPAIKTE